MADTELTPEEVEATVDRRVQVRLPRRGDVGLPVAAAASTRTSCARSRRTRTSPSGCSTSALAAYEHLMQRPMPTWGADLSKIDFDNIYYYLKPVAEQAKSWDDLPDGHAARPGTSWASPRPRRSSWPASAPNTSPRSSTTTCRRIWRSRASSSWTWTPACASTRISCASTLARSSRPTTTSSRRSTRPCGRAARSSTCRRACGRAAAAGLLPHQRREHGPVRADADHRRRGRLRALRRGLHRPDLLDRLAALRGGRDPRRRGRPLPLHHHPELVEERLQPGHQARGRREERHHGVGRRQPRLADHP